MEATQLPCIVLRSINTQPCFSNEEKIGEHSGAEKSGGHNIFYEEKTREERDGCWRWKE